MTCGQANAQSPIYKKVVGKSGANWFIPVNHPEPGAGVQVHYANGKYSYGYGGATLEFNLEDGTTYKAQGPWHSNSEACLNDTGVDLTAQHLTFVVLAMDRQGYPTELVDVIYIDKEPTLGRFDRYKELIKQYPQAKVYYSESSGGSSCGLITDYDRQ